MNGRRVEAPLYGAIGIMAALGAGVFFGIAPLVANECLWMYPELAHLYWPGLGFCWWIALLCYGMLLCLARIARRIGLGRSFSRENARTCRRIGMLALIAAASMLLPEAIFSLARQDSGPAVLLLSAAGLVGFLVVALLAFPVARLVDQAADIQSENALTI